jgi:hypothetical protein
MTLALGENLQPEYFTIAVFLRPVYGRKPSLMVKSTLYPTKTLDIHRVLATGALDVATIKHPGSP